MASSFGLGSVVGVESDQLTFSTDNLALWQYDGMGNVVNLVINQPQSNKLRGYVSVSASICDLI